MGNVIPRWTQVFGTARIETSWLCRRRWTAKSTEFAANVFAKFANTLKDAGRVADSSTPIMARLLVGYEANVDNPPNEISAAG